MNQNTINETFEYRVAAIVKKALNATGAEDVDFPNTDALLDYLYNADIAKILGNYLVDDMTEWADNWLELVRAK